MWTSNSFKVPYLPTCSWIGDKLMCASKWGSGASGDAACDSSTWTTAQCTDNKDSIWIMLLISWGTGPFSVGDCPWSLCTAAIDKHTHSTPRLSSITALRERYEVPKTNASFCFLFPLQWLDIFFHGASQRPHTENKVMPALPYCTWCHLKRATEERYENPVETRAVGSPSSTPWEWSALNNNEHPDSPDTKSTRQYRHPHRRF